MDIDISVIKAKVRLLLDEQGINEGEFAEVVANQGERDESYLDNIIEGKAEEALQYVYLNADASLVPWTSDTSSSSTPSIVDDFSYDPDQPTRVGEPIMYVLELSSSLLRWESVKIDGWSRMVPREEAIEINSPQYAMLSDEHCTGTTQRPRVAIERTGEDTTLYLYKTKYTSTGFPKSYTIRYVTRPKYQTYNVTVSTTSKKLVVGEKLVDAFYYYLGGLVCMVLGDERQQGFFQQAAELMGKTINNE